MRNQIREVDPTPAQRATMIILSRLRELGCKIGSSKVPRMLVVDGKERPLDLYLAEAGFLGKDGAIDPKLVP